MASESLGQIFSSSTTKKLELLISELQASGITDPVGTTAFPGKQLSFSTSDSQVKVLDLTATFGAQATAQASIDAPTTQIAPFDKTTPLSPPSGSSYGVLSVTGKLSAGTSGTVSSTPLSISAAAAASLAYTHYLPVAATDTRLAALTKLVSTAELPQFSSLTNLANGEVSTMEAALSLDLGIKAKYGSSFDLADTLSFFDGLSAQIKASVQYGIEASLGWSLSDDFTLTVANAQQKNAGWTRIRIDRTHNNTFTAGATFALQVDYDVSSLATVLEKIFEMTPLPRVISILEQVQSTTWDQLAQKVSDRASQDLISYIAGTGWKEKAANSPEVKAALDAIDKVVSTYNTIDTKVQQLWSELLTKVDLQSGSTLRTAIDKIAALDPTNPDLTQFLSPAAQKDADLLEQLTGKSVEQLLVGSSVAVQTAISTAVSLAKQLERVINDTPSTITTAIQTFSKEHGIQSAIQFLANNDSLDKIEANADAAITKLVEKLVGKVFNAIGDDEYKKVQAWATKLLTAWQDITNKLAAAAKFLKGTIGFNVSLEFSRVTESSAVLDFEVNPANADAVSAVKKNLPFGNVHDMLVALNGIKPDNAGNVPYLIRESMIVSRHVRTGATTVLLSIFGLSNLQKVTGSRFDESSVTFTQTGRTATFNGGFVQGVTVTDSSSECGAWLAADASDTTSINPNVPFPNVSRAMHLTFARTDNASTADEIKAITTLLVDLGFFATGAANPAANDGAQTSFTLDIVLDENAVKTFVSDDGEDNWNKDYRNAAYRLLKDDLVADKIAALNQPTGEVLAAVVKTDLFTDTWTDTSTTKFRQDPRAKSIGIGGKTLQILDNTTNQFIPPYIPIQMLIVRRPAGIGAMKSVSGSLAASGSAKQTDLSKLVESSAALFAKTSFPEWDNPMFNFWFVVARLRRLGAAVLANAKGYATFRTRATANDAWSNPQQWQLTQGQGVFIPDAKKTLLFPF